MNRIGSQPALQGSAAPTSLWESQMVPQILLYKPRCTSLALIFRLWNATVSVSPLVTLVWKYARCHKTNDVLVSEHCTRSICGTPRCLPQTCVAARVLGQSSDSAWCLQELLLDYINATNNNLVLELPKTEWMKRKKCTLRTFTKCHKLMPGLVVNSLGETTRSVYRL